MTLPDHYFELDPFREAFRTGTPALLYHRLGRAPLFSSHRGLTLPERVFARQLSELKQEGFKTLWLTFDDGDATAMAALEPLRTHGFQATQFLVADRLGGVNDWDQTGAPLMDDAQVREWLASGHRIGSHTLTHARLPTLSPAAAREEVASSKKRLEDRFSTPVESFAYPWGEWNEQLAQMVAEAGYTNAFTTEPGVNPAGHSPRALRRNTVWCALRRPRELWHALTS